VEGSTVSVGERSPPVAVLGSLVVVFVTVDALSLGVPIFVEVVLGVRGVVPDTAVMLLGETVVVVDDVVAVVVVVGVFVFDDLERRSGPLLVGFKGSFLGEVFVGVRTKAFVLMILRGLGVEGEGGGAFEDVFVVSLLVAEWMKAGENVDCGVSVGGVVVKRIASEVLRERSVEREAAGVRE